MREMANKERLLSFIDLLGRTARGPGRVYLTGGASALLLGVRNQTVDIDIKLDPEPKGVFEGIAALKERLSLNVELASPDLFIPALPGWRERSEFIATSGEVDFYHYDFYGQALAKILRGHRTDLSDARAYVELGKVNLPDLLAHFAAIKPELIRYPSIDPGEFEKKVVRFVESEGNDGPF